MPHSFVITLNVVTWTESVGERLSSVSSAETNS